MRYYKLEITDQSGRTPMTRDGTPIGPFDTSKCPGRGLQIEFDALITGYDVVNSGTMITISGLPISMLNQAVNLSGYTVNLYAGFTKGLPLENWRQQGLIISGEILKPYANWQGTHQTMNLIVNPSPLLNKEGKPFSITLQSKEGAKLSDALKTALEQAYPGFNVQINISDKLVLSEDSPGNYTKLEPLASTIRSQSLSIINDASYSGVQIIIQGRTIRVFDSSNGVLGKAKQIFSYELIGQPTWIAYNKVSFKCPLRSEIYCGDSVELPKDIISGPASILSVNSSESSAWLRKDVNFSGEFQVTSVRHVGDYLSADSSNAWVTIYEALVKDGN